MIPAENQKIPARCRSFGTVVEVPKKEVESEVVANETLSIGIAEFRSGMKLQDLKDAADSAMYNAKNKGRNTIALAKTS